MRKKEDFERKIPGLEELAEFTLNEKRNLLYKLVPNLYKKAMKETWEEALEDTKAEMNKWIEALENKVIDKELYKEGMHFLSLIVIVISLDFLGRYR